MVPVTTTDPQWLLDHLEVHGDADLLIFDFQMPKMNGITLLDRLRKRGFLAPALLVSALTSREVRDAARRLGVVGILEKPVSTRALLERIREVVGAGRGDALADDASSSTLAG
jgi:CheY-like chemotaxis protein